MNINSGGSINFQRISPFPMLNNGEAVRAEDNKIFQTGQNKASAEENRALNNEHSDTVDAQGAASTNVQFTREELKKLSELKQTDTKVRQHEMAHLSVAGGLAVSGANFTYQKGPDGKQYAVGGEVKIDTSPIPGDPEATLKKMQQVRNAALAPASPSPQDVKVASEAMAMVSKALSDIMALKVQEKFQSDERPIFGNLQNSLRTYADVGAISEKEPTSFQLSV